MKAPIPSLLIISLVLGACGSAPPDDTRAIESSPTIAPDLAAPDPVAPNSNLPSSDESPTPTPVASSPSPSPEPVAVATATPNPSPSPTATQAFSLPPKRPIPSIPLWCKINRAKTLVLPNFSRT